MLIWFKRVALGLVALIAVALICGFAYEQWSRWNAPREYPPPGQLVEVDGRKMHINCTGSGAPTVILESGLTNWGSVSWVLVQPEIAKTNRVCSYDRAGMLWSDRREEAPTADTIAGNLHTLLETVSEAPPYVLVGHSYGGVLIRLFANRYPQEVDALVFVDSSHPDQFERYAQLYGEDESDEPWWLIPYERVTAETGAMRLFRRPAADRFPAEALMSLRYFPQNLDAVIAEFNTLDAISAAARETKSFGDLPIIVLTAGEQLEPPDEEAAEMTSDEIEEWRKDGKLWLELQAEIAALSTNSDHRIVEGSRHFIPFAAPESIVQAIREVLTMDRQKGHIAELQNERFGIAQQ